MIPFARLFWMIALPPAAFIAPNILLTRLVKRRREKIRRSIPDAIDLLVICVDAGLGIDQALLRVGQELGISHPQITEELLQINLQATRSSFSLACAAQAKCNGVDPSLDVTVALAPCSRSIDVIAGYLE